MKYPVRLALNPLVSTIGWYLPLLFSGSVIVATVLNLPTIGPMLLRSLTVQDMFLAGSDHHDLPLAGHHRHADLRYPAGLAGSAYPHGGLMVVDATSEPEDIHKTRSRRHARRLDAERSGGRRRRSGPRRPQLETGLVALSQTPAGHGQRRDRDLYRASWRWCPSFSAPWIPTRPAPPNPSCPCSGCASLATASSGPFVYGIAGARNPETLRMEWQIDEEIIVPVAFFVRGFEYKMLGLITDRHPLVGHGR